MDSYHGTVGCNIFSSSCNLSIAELCTFCQTKLITKKKTIKDVRDRSIIMVCQVKFGAKILPAYSHLDIRVKQQLQQGENASLHVIGQSI